MRVPTVGRHKPQPYQARWYHNVFTGYNPFRCTVTVYDCMWLYWSFIWYNVYIHCLEEGCIGLYTDISRGLRDVPGTMPEGHPDWIVDTSPGTFPSWNILVVWDIQPNTSLLLAVYVFNSRHNIILSCCLKGTNQKLAMWSYWVQSIPQYHTALLVPDLTSN